MAGESRSARAVEKQLAKYREMRDFGITAEPAGGSKNSKERALPFVVQKHAATRLHYDFRLGWKGVLKSWAVAKGPSDLTADKRLAVEVEDHPIEYAGFEGTIPRGQYGGGTVMVWDQGTWEPQPGHDFDEGLKKGSLKFILHGTKMKGKWALIRMGGKAAKESEPNWLLIKEHDQYERDEKGEPLTERLPNSVVTGRDLDAIGAEQDHVWQSKASKSDTSEKGATAEEKMRARLLAKKSQVEKAAKPTGRSNSDAIDTKPKLKRASVAANRPNSRKAAPSPNATKKLPGFIPPQLTVQLDEPPPGDGWVHELKLDGYRIQAHIQAAGTAKNADRSVILYSRNGLDWTHRMSTVSEALETLPVESAILDGEVVVLDAEGHTSFADLQASFQDHVAKPLTYFLFDLLFLNGDDLRTEPMTERKDQLKKLLPKGSAGTLRYSEEIAGDGKTIFTHACRIGAEGIVSKRTDSRYASGRQSSWVKAKCIREQEFVIGGFTPPAKGNRALGALLLGYYDGGKLIYAGRTGTGFTMQSAVDLQRRLEKLKQTKNPFASLPKGAGKDAVWVKPELVGVVAFATWTADKLVRQASFQGLREDKASKDVRREVPKHTTPEAAPEGAAPNPMAEKPESPPATSKVAKKSLPANMPEVRLTHPDKIVDSESGLTKLQLLEYLLAASPNILPHIEGRPLSLVRCPSGTGKPCFFQKHIGQGMPEGIDSVVVPDKKTGKPEDYVTLSTAKALGGLAQMGVLEFHPWGSRNQSLEKPDRIIFDLDPDADIPWKTVASAAEEIRERLRAIQLESFVKSTGGKGLHVVAPLKPEYAWDVIKQFCRALAAQMEADNPAQYLIKMSKAERRGKIFVDYLRNERGATAVAAFSPRARPGCPVAVTMDWSELRTLRQLPHFRVIDFNQWRSRLENDPWMTMDSVKQRLSAASLKSFKVEAR
jgi:bifunctional non-homologous end joining protein LigD